MCFDFLYNSIRKISHSKKNRAKYYHKFKNVFMRSTFCSCQILIDLNILAKFSKKFSRIKFHEKLSSGSRVFPCEREGGPQTDMTQLIFALRNFANTQENLS